MSRTDPELARVWDGFHAVVNMPSPDLRAWLGIAPADQEQYLYEPDFDPHELGAAVLGLLEKRRVDLTAADVETMRRVIDLAGAWLANPREGEPDATRWRQSLMCLGHDPLKADSPHGPDAAVLSQ